MPDVVQHHKIQDVSGTDFPKVRSNLFVQNHCRPAAHRRGEKNNAPLITMRLKGFPKSINRCGFFVSAYPTVAIASFEMRGHHIYVELFVFNVMSLEFNRVGAGAGRFVNKLHCVFEIFFHGPVLLGLDKVLARLGDDKNAFL